MNLLVSYNWLKEFIKTNESPERLARLLSLSGPSVERSKNLGKFFDGMVVGVIKELKPHPDADRLRLAMVDIGDRTVTIVCGGTNLALNQKVFVALPGAKVRWHGEGDLVTLAPTKIRGVESFGMICAPSEVGFEKLQGGEREIWDLTKITDAKAGTPIASALQLNDTIFDIEVTSNRPDAMSVVGIAREAAVITNAKFLYKEGNVEMLECSNVEMPFSVRVTEKGLCPRFSGIIVDGIRVGPSPWWMQKRLLMAGLRPINNIVDITNYVMLEQGKPLHAFDAEKLSGNSIVVRRAKKGEKLMALDGKTYELTDSMLVIADKEKPAAIAGVMGGQSSGVTEKTTRIIFESAVFNPVSIRKTARALNLHSEASNLFEKGLSAESTLPALARAVELTLQIAGGHVASKLADVATKQPKRKPITFDGATVKRFLGIDIPQKEVARILTALGFSVKVKKLHVTRYTLQVTAPWFRPDVTMDQDLVEEVGRIYGYHRLPATLPTGTLPIQSPDERKEFFWERRVKELLRGAGFTETMSYSFVSEPSLQKLGYDPTTHLSVANPLSDEYVYLRQHLSESLLDIVVQNQNNRDSIALFELAKMYQPKGNHVLEEPLRLGGIMYEKNKADDVVSVFRRARGIVHLVLGGMGISTEQVTYVQQKDFSNASWVDPIKSLQLEIHGEPIGWICAPKKNVLRTFGIEGTVVYFPLRFDLLLRYARIAKRYIPLPKYPPVLRDLAFVLPKAVAYADVATTLQKNPLVVSVELFDLYEGAQVGEGKKSMAFHLCYQLPDRTLTNQEVEQAESAIVKEVEKKFQAKLRDV